MAAVVADDLGALRSMLRENPTRRACARRARTRRRSYTMYSISVIDSPPHRPRGYTR